MPTYDYICNECGYTFELFQGIHDEPEKSCPHCSGAVRRIISGGAGIIFKGSGFYVTDNKKQGTSTDNSVKNSDTKKESADSGPVKKPEPTKGKEKVKAADSHC
jgi:putative FmdB family regulatory protein